jgi:hypothetical protein
MQAKLLLSSFQVGQFSSLTRRKSLSHFQTVRLLLLSVFFSRERASKGIAFALAMSALYS